MKLPRKPEAVIFDMDGLLFDTEKLSCEAAISASRSLGYEMDWHFYKTWIGCSWPTINELLRPYFGVSFPTDEFRQNWVDHYQGLLETQLAMKAGVVEILDMLDQHTIPRAVATSSPPDKASYKLHNFDLWDRFDHVLAAGDYAAGKPAPDPFLMAAERLGISPEACVVLEDSHNGIRSAHAAGTMAIMIPDLLEPTEDIRSLCVHVLDDLHEVAAMIDRYYR